MIKYSGSNIVYSFLNISGVPSGDSEKRLHSYFAYIMYMYMYAPIFLAKSRYYNVYGLRTDIDE